MFNKIRILTYISVIGAVISFSFTFCNTNNNSKTNSFSNKSKNFDWILGEWKRNNEEQGKETFEIWEKISNSQYSGIGFTMQNGDTVKQERVKLIKQNGKWDMIVKVSQETESITFNMTNLTKDSFTCENDSIDFPKFIKYWNDNGNLNALVTGNDMEIPFGFEKIK
jgi:hypothetical protein